MKTAIFIIAFFASLCGFAQPELGMHANYTITPAAATSSLSQGLPYSSTITITCFVQNKGNAAFSGTVALYKSIHSGTFQSTPKLGNSINTTLNPTDTVKLTFVDTILVNSYKQNGNGNTIVVWPYSSSAITIDSLFTAPVFVSNSTGIAELDRNPLFLYPNPVSTELFIKPKEGIDYKEVRIYDLQLREILIVPFSSKINVSSLPSGTYIISIRDANDVIHSSRLNKIE